MEAAAATSSPTLHEADQAGSRRLARKRRASSSWAREVSMAHHRRAAFSLIMAGVCLPSSSALAHDGPCDGAAEVDLTEPVRRAAEALRSSWQTRHGRLGSERVQLLGLNDFHGRLSS